MAVDVEAGGKVVSCAAAGVDWDEDVDERALVVGLDDGTRRSVFLQFALNGGYDGRLVRVNAHKDVAAAQVVEVVGECADTVVNALGVPTLLEHYAVGLNLLLIQQVGYVDW